MKYAIEYLCSHKNRTNFVIKSTKSLLESNQKGFCFVFVWAWAYIYQQNCSKGETLEVNKHNAAAALCWSFEFTEALYDYYFSFQFFDFQVLEFSCLWSSGKIIPRNTIFHMRPFFHRKNYFFSSVYLFSRVYSTKTMRWITFVWRGTKKKLFSFEIKISNYVIWFVLMMVTHHRLTFQWKPIKKKCRNWMKFQFCFILICNYIFFNYTLRFGLIINDASQQNAVALTISNDMLCSLAVR